MTHDDQANEGKTKMLSLRVPVELYEKIKYLADQDRRKVHNFALIALEDQITTLLKRQSEKPAQ